MKTPLPDHELALWLRQEMRRRAYHQAELARRAGLTSSAVSQILHVRRTYE